MYARTTPEGLANGRLPPNVHKLGVGTAAIFNSFVVNKIIRQLTNYLQ